MTGEARSAAYTREDWIALWHHLCARRAELTIRGSSTDELDRLIKVAYARSH